MASAGGGARFRGFLPGLQYFVVVDGWIGYEGNFQLEITCTNAGGNMVDADGNIMTPAPTSSDQPLMRAEERDALMDIYNTMGGTGWTRSDGWGTATDHCDWYGVDCYDDVNVVELNLQNNGLTGGE